MSAKTVFISYSHDSPEHSERIRALGASLSRDGCECHIDVLKDTDEDWPAWMTRQLVESDFVLCVVTETYARRFNDKELPDVGLGVGWEAGLIRKLLYAKKLRNNRIFPVVFDNSDRDHIPLELEGYDYFLLSEQSAYETLLRKLLNRPVHARPTVGRAPNLQSQTTAPLFSRPDGEVSSTSDTNADISRILKYAPENLIGREDELKMLTDAWIKVQNQEKGRPHVLTFVALGGEGKTSLVAKWAAELAAQDWPDCDAAFAWSFYSQGTHEQQAASSDLFLKEALMFFGNEADKKFAASPAGAFEKGQRLARIVGQRRNLLILDGLEPLQYPPHPPHDGALKDQGIAALLKGLATNSQGLCVITTRYSLPDLNAFKGKTVHEEKLPRLSRAAGVHLLKSLGVRGTVQEHETLVEDVKGHALTLQIMGGFLRRAFGGDVRQRDRVKFEKADERIDGGHAFRAMEAYAKWLEDGGDESKRELAILRILGLFDRPADSGCVGALRREPAIADLTESLVGLDEADWNLALSSLAECGLVSFENDQSASGNWQSAIDSHPHIREYFAKQVRESNPDAWRAAHRRLYKHLCENTHEGEKPTLEDLQPLYQAVAHGCLAGLQQEARSEVWFERIRKANDNYSVRKLGALGFELGAVASFFENPWNGVTSALDENTQSIHLNYAAYTLRALGRLVESLEPMRVSGEMDVKVKEWQGAAISYSNLSELELTLGEVAGAAGDAERSVTYADRSGDLHMRQESRCTHGDALYQAGDRSKAETRFREAEEIHAKGQPETPLLYSVRGFKYCDLLLGALERAAWQKVSGEETVDNRQSLVAAYRDVSRRAAQTLDWSVSRFDFSLLTIALDHLTVGRAELYGAIFEKAEIRNSQAGIERAVDGLRRSGHQQHLPQGLLTRAWLRFLTGARTGPESAQEDLDEAWEIAERGPMKLHMADIHLYRARLFGVPSTDCQLPIEEQYPWNRNPDSSRRGPKDDLDAAEKLINECGYHRRDEELADARRAVNRES